MIVNPITGCSPAAMRVYLVHVDNPSATFPEIAEGLGVSMRTVQRAVKELESVGLVMRERRTTDYGVPMPSTLALGDRDSSVVMVESDRDSSVVSPQSYQGGDRDSSVGVNGRYVVSSKQIGLSEEVLRTSSSRAAEPLVVEGAPVGYEFFGSTEADDAPPPRGKRKPQSSRREDEARSKALAVRDWTDVSKWTSLDVAQHWRHAVGERYPLKVSSSGKVKTMAQIFAKRGHEYGETNLVQVAMIESFLVDPRNVAQAGNGVTLQQMLLAFMNRNAEGARDALKRADRKAETEAKEAALATDDPVEDAPGDKGWDLLAAALDRS